MTSDFVYWRLHGSAESYLAKGYSTSDIKWFAERATRWSQGDQAADACLIDSSHKKLDHPPRDIFIYFDNEAKEYAPHHACALLKKLQTKSTQAA